MFANNTTMFFSFLIAHYNNFDYFRDCYINLQKQTHQNFEIILVDDCSTDGSFDKIKDFVKADSRVKFHHNPENKGVGFTKRKCVDLATGEFCGFVDPDDAITENALEEMLKAYTSEKTVVAYSQLQLCDNQLNIQKTFQASKQIKNGDPLFFNIFLEANHFFTFRRSAYEKTSGINAELSSAVDQDLYLKLYETGDFKFVKQPLYLYRLHDKGVSQEKSKKGKLNQNWHKVIAATLKRRNITDLYGKAVADISNLPEFLYKNQNTFWKKLSRKFL